MNDHNREAWVSPYSEQFDHLTLHDPDFQTLCYNICFTVNVFIYLYKYLFKGPDRTWFTIQAKERHVKSNKEPVDEIKDYVAARYLSATETAWRILSYHITRKEPAVTSIYIHLPGTNFA